MKQEPLGYSFMPGYLNIDSVHIQLPKSPEEILDTNLPDFKTIPIEAGRLRVIEKKDTSYMDIPAGLLISEATGVKYVFYKAGYDRQSKELEMSQYLLKEYYNKAKSAEVVYQLRIQELEKKNERSWLERNMGYIGFIAGLATAVITEFAVIKASK
jgi:hypothetical protein